MRAPMQDNTNDGVGELQDMRSEIGEAKECRVCKYVLLFSFLVLLSVMTLVYFQGKGKFPFSPSAQQETEEEFGSLPPSPEQAEENARVFDQRILELDVNLSRVDHSSFSTSSQSVVVTGKVPFKDGRPVVLE